MEQKTACCNAKNGSEDYASSITPGGIIFSKQFSPQDSSAMTTVSTEDPQFQSAIQACAVALQRLADYELDPSLHRWLRELGERKEFLSPAEHEELLALVGFAHQRTLEKLEARAALERLRTALPGVLSDA
jgi:hypothetical protein